MASAGGTGRDVGARDVQLTSSGGLVRRGVQWWPTRTGPGSGQGVSEPLVGVDELVAPGPGLVDAHVELPATGGETGDDVQEPVAQRLGVRRWRGLR